VLTLAVDRKVMSEQKILPSLGGMIHELGVGDNDSLRHDQAREQTGAINGSRSVAISSRRPLGAVNANEAAEAPTKISNARIVVRYRLPPISPLPYKEPLTPALAPTEIEKGQAGHSLCKM
jgi:hypothetical protein